MSDSFIASAWCNGSEKHASYGIRFGVVGRKLVDGTPDRIRLTLLDGPVIDAPVTAGFWKKCPEVRHPEIGAWFCKIHLTLPWPAGAPHRFNVTKTRRNSFSVVPL